MQHRVKLFLNRLEAIGLGAIFLVALLFAGCQHGPSIRIKRHGDLARAFKPIKLPSAKIQNRIVKTAKKFIGKRFVSSAKRRYRGDFDFVQ